MCDVNRYRKIYDELKKLQPEDTLELVLESESQEEQDFFEMIGNFFMQREQRKVIKANKF